MTGTHPLAAQHLLPFVAPPGETDSLPEISCSANSFTRNDDRLLTEDTVGGTRLALHEVTKVGPVHAMLPRLQGLIVPVTPLLLSWGH
jgi:hypothetical protein